MTVVASNYAREENDLYQTEPWATQALLRHFPVQGLTVWEPSAGNHLMADVLAEAGASVLPSDLITYDRPHAWEADFFAEPTAIPCDAIITNPPYGKSNKDDTDWRFRASRELSDLMAHKAAVLDHASPLQKAKLEQLSWLRKNDPDEQIRKEAEKQYQMLWQSIEAELG